MRLLSSTLVLLSAILISTSVAFAQPTMPPVDQTLVGNAGSPFTRLGSFVAGDGHLLVTAGDSERQHFLWSPGGWTYVTDAVFGADDLSMRGEFYIYRSPTGNVQRRRFDGVSVTSGGYSAGLASSRAVAIAPDRFAVGFPENGSGFVNIYHTADGLTFTLEEGISGSTVGERFGASLEFDETGTVLWVGAPGDGSGLTGRVERRVWSGTNWVPFGELKSPLEEADNFYGSAIAADGQRLIVGAPGHDFGLPAPAADVGAAYLYQNGEIGALNLEWGFTGTEAGDALGSSVDLLDDAAIAGVPGRDILVPFDTPTPGEASGAEPDGTPIFDAGEAQVYWRTGPAIWRHVASLRRSPTLEDEVGSSVALVGRTALVGVPGLDGSGVNEIRGGVLSFRGVNAIFVDGFEGGDTSEWSNATL